MQGLPGGTTLKMLFLDFAFTRIYLPYWHPNTLILILLFCYQTLVFTSQMSVGRWVCACMRACMCIYIFFEDRCASEATFELRASCLSLWVLGSQACTTTPGFSQSLYSHLSHMGVHWVSFRWIQWDKFHKHLSINFVKKAAQMYYQVLISITKVSRPFS